MKGSGRKSPSCLPRFIFHFRYKNHSTSTTPIVTSVAPTAMPAIAPTERLVDADDDAFDDALVDGKEEGNTVLEEGSAAEKVTLMVVDAQRVKSFPSVADIFRMRRLLEYPLQCAS